MSLKSILIAGISTAVLTPSLSLAQAAPPPVAPGLFGGITAAGPIAGAAIGIGVVGVVVVVSGDSTTTATTGTN